MKNISKILLIVFIILVLVVLSIINPPRNEKNIEDFQDYSNELSNKYKDNITNIYEEQKEENLTNGAAIALPNCPEGQYPIFYLEAEEPDRTDPSYDQKTNLWCGVLTEECNKKSVGPGERAFYYCPARPGKTPRACPIGQVLIQDEGCGKFRKGCYRPDLKNQTYICPSS